MGRTACASLTALSIVLLIIPLLAVKPGLPPTLKGDEPAYLAMAWSLVHDRDLRCEVKDLERLFQAFPYLPVQNLILMSDDGWNTVYYGKPYLQSFLAAPLVALLGGNGLIAFNMLLLVAMIWMGFFYLREHNDENVAALASAGFFLGSTAFVYVFWQHTEMLGLFATTACLYFALPRRGPTWPPRWQAWEARVAAWSPVLSASCLALGVYNKPVLAAFALPVLLYYLRQRRWRWIVMWCAASVVASAAYASGSYVLTGHATPYLGVSRAGLNIHDPLKLPIDPVVLPPSQVTNEGGEKKEKVGTGGWWWIFRVPETSFAEVGEDLRYFLFGRHTGLFLYMPFSLLCLLLFLAHGRRSLERWGLLLALAVIAAFFLLFIPFNWQGGGGFVGNRYFVLAYPGFLFLVTRIAPLWCLLPAFATAGAFLGLLWLTPYGAAVPSPTLQSHTRGAAYQPFPFELSLREVPGYTRVLRGQLWLQGPRHQFQEGAGKALWFHGNDRTLVWLQSSEPVEELTFQVRSILADNTVRVSLEDDSMELVAGPEGQRVVLRPSAPAFRRLHRTYLPDQPKSWLYLYRLRVETEGGVMPNWVDQGRRFFFLGAILEPVQAAAASASE